MGKKKHAEHVNHERWLVSYADFITLLFAFFVVLFASSQSDKKKQAKLAAAMQSAFQYGGIFDEHAKTPPLNDEAGAAPAATPAPLAVPIPTQVEQEKEIKEIEQHIEEHLHNEVGADAGSTHDSPKPEDKFDLGSTRAFQPERKPSGIDSVTVHSSAEGIVVSLREAGFFNSGSAELRPESIALVRAVAESLPHQTMRIEGHTDDRPIHTPQFATNWELSTARAASVTRILLNLHAADPSAISAAGYAEFQPTADNKTEEGRAQNRRVDIVLLSPK